jgi:hypothetical protein
MAFMRVLDMDDNVIPILKNSIEFENWICPCGSELFFISVNFRAVCYKCRCWMLDDEIILDGEKK